VVRTFCKALRKYLTEHPSVDRLASITYVGPAINVARRKTGHESHGALSNWLTDLLESISKSFFDGKYGFQTFVVCLLAEYDQGAIAEMALTTLGSAYYWTGLGCCIGRAGERLHIGSLATQGLTDDEKVEKWFQWQE
jgi:hypothetical protein